uniref:Uncharacterized protein n=1 Tax=Cacopsylla melanoneura TaxID=428564 RepID=A0A8D9A5Y1_9HEMI
MSLPHNILWDGRTARYLHSIFSLFFSVKRLKACACVSVCRFAIKDSSDPHTKYINCILRAPGRRNGWCISCRTPPLSWSLPPKMCFLVFIFCIFSKAWIILVICNLEFGQRKIMVTCYVLLLLCSLVEEKIFQRVLKA